MEADTETCPEKMMGFGKGWGEARTKKSVFIISKSESKSYLVITIKPHCIIHKS